MAPICTDVRRKFAKTIELQALNLTLVSCPKGAFPLPNTVHARNPLRDERPVPVPPELWRLPPIWPWALSLLRSSLFSSPFSPHSSTSPSSPQSERGVNKPHVSGKNLERAASQTKVPRTLLPLPPPSLSSTLSLGTGLDGFRWMAAVCWGRMAAGADGGGVMSSSAVTLGGATSVLHWRGRCRLWNWWMGGWSYQYTECGVDLCLISIWMS